MPLNLIIDFYSLKRNQLRKLFAILLFIGVWAEFPIAQNLGSHYRIRSYSRAEGLGQSQVRDILQDRRGYLWMALQGGGASRFDGLRFQAMKMEEGLIGNDIGALCEDAAGNLWFACDQRGLSRYDGKTVQSYGKGQGIDFVAASAMMATSDDQILVGTLDDGLIVWDGTKARQFRKKEGLSGDSVLCFLQMDARTLWMGTNRGIMQMVDGKVSKLDSTRYPNCPQNLCNAMLKRKNGEVIGSNGSKGLWRFGPNGFSYDSIMASKEVKALFEDNEGNLWASADKCVYLVAAQGGVKKFGTANGLKDVDANCIMQDRNGNIWLGMEGAGAIKFSKEPFVLYGAGTPFASRAVFAMHETDPGHYYIGTEIGLFEMQQGVITPAAGLPESEPYIFDLETDVEGNLLVAANMSYMVRNGKYEPILLEGTSTPLRVSSFARSQNGDIHVCTQKGIFKIVGNRALKEDTSSYDFLYEAPRITAGTGNTLFLHSLTSGTTRIADGVATNFSAPAHLPDEQAISFTMDHNGGAWVGTQGGLARISDQGSCYLTTAEGLAGDLIYILTVDHQGHLWAGTDFGLSRITIDKNSEPLEIRNYGLEDGFVGLECNQGAEFVDHEGKLWFGTIEGLQSYDPRLDMPDLYPPHVEITKLQVHLENIDWQKQGATTLPWTGVPVDLELGAEQNHIRIEFVGITHRLPEKVKYRYRLVGLDESLSQPTAENHAVYPFLPPGDYTFEVYACNAQQVWTKDPVKLHFTIRAPFYRTGWFGVASFLAILFILVAIVRLRTNTLQKQRAILEKKVRQRTEALEQANQVKGEFLAKMSHEIRTPMNGVIGMTDLLERTQLSPQQRKFVENIRVSGQNLLNLINDILDFSRIESGKLELEHIPFEIRHSIEEVMDILAFSAFSKGLELLYWVDPEIRGPVLGDPARLKQILTNLIGNSIKFTAKGEISVRVNLVKNDGDTAWIQVSVKDTGIGIPKEKHDSLFESFTQVDASTTRKYGGTGLGLAISYNLSKVMGGQMWVESEPGRGTEFFFTFQGGISEPWRFQGDAHPAKALDGKKVVLAMQNPSMISLIAEYLQHWRMTLECHNSVEAATDAALDQPDVDFLFVDLRLTHGEPNVVARSIAAACKRRKLQFALLAEPDIAIILQNYVGENGWVLSKPLKRDDLLQALMGQRATSQPLELGEQTPRFAATLPLRILVAEDNPINQDVANGMLASLGYTVINTVNGVETVELVRKGNIDLVFMDVQMPVMDGLEATRIIVSELPRDRRPVIVAMTANAMESDRQRCLEAGMDTFISKPFLMNELAKVLRSVPALRAGAGASNMGSEPDIPTLETANPPLQVETAAPASNYKLTDMTMLDAVSGGESAFVLGILSKLVVKLPEAVEELRMALASEDWETIRATSHRTKSSAAYSGSEALKDKFKELEHMAREREDLDQIPAKLDLLEAFVTEIVGELKQHIAERS